MASPLSPNFTICIMHLTGARMPIRRASKRIAVAARTSGIGLTLLPVLYQTSGLEGVRRRGAAAVHQNFQ